MSFHPYRVTTRMRYANSAGANHYGVKTCWEWCEADAERIRSTGKQAEARLLEGECWVERLDWKPVPYDRRDEHIKSVVAALERDHFPDLTPTITDTRKIAEENDHGRR